MEHQSSIEAKWDKQFGDRTNELVFIGQEMNIEKIKKDLNKCLCTPKEIEDWETGKYFEDHWPLMDSKTIMA